MESTNTTSFQAPLSTNESIQNRDPLPDYTHGVRSIAPPLALGSVFEGFIEQNALKFILTDTILQHVKVRLPSLTNIMDSLSLKRIQPACRLFTPHR